jgi:hypothetical protein
VLRIQGVQAGTIRDWSAKLGRTSATLKSYQERIFMTTLMQNEDVILRASIERHELEPEKLRALIERDELEPEKLRALIERDELEPEKLRVVIERDQSEIEKLRVFIDCDHAMGMMQWGQV